MRSEFADKEIKPRKVEFSSLDVCQIHVGTFLAFQKPGDKIAAQHGTFCCSRLPIVCHRSDPAAPHDPQPGAASNKVASCKNLRMIIPVCGRNRWTIVELVAICDQYERMIGANIVGEIDYAHLDSELADIAMTARVSDASEVDPAPSSLFSAPISNAIRHWVKRMR